MSHRIKQLLDGLQQINILIPGSLRTVAEVNAPSHLTKKTN